MAKSATILLTIAGADTGPFNLLSDADGYTISFDTGVAKSSLVAGYDTNSVPDAATIIRVQSSSSLCTNFVDLTYPLLPTPTPTPIPPTATPTPTPVGPTATPTPTPIPPTDTPTPTPVPPTATPTPIPPTATPTPTPVTYINYIAEAYDCGSCTLQSTNELVSLPSTVTPSYGSFYAPSAGSGQQGVFSYKLISTGPAGAGLILEPGAYASCAIACSIIP